MPATKLLQNFGPRYAKKPSSLIKMLLIILLGAITAYILNTQKPTIQTYISRWTKFSFCDKTVYYKIGNVDNRFGLTTQEITQYAADGAKIWNTLADKTLFAYDSTADLTINMVYDERQGSLSSITKQKAQVDNQKQQLETNISQFETQKYSLNQQITSLNQEIEEWNLKGGAPKDVYNRIISEQKDLQQKVADINAKAQKLNKSAETVNQTISTINKDVEKFNSILKVKPEEGIYRGATNTIDIFIYSSDHNLTHTIAHELGHALGLGHIDNPKALMYPESTSDSEPTQDDKRLLDTYCQEQDRLELIKNDIKNTVLMIYTQMNRE